MYKNTVNNKKTQKMERNSQNYIKRKQKPRIM